MDERASKLQSNQRLSVRSIATLDTLDALEQELEGIERELERYAGAEAHDAAARRPRREPLALSFSLRAARGCCS